MYILDQCHNIRQASPSDKVQNAASIAAHPGHSRIKTTLKIKHAQQTDKPFSIITVPHPIFLLKVSIKTQSPQVQNSVPIDVLCPRVRWINFLSDHLEFKYKFNCAVNSKLLYARYCKLDVYTL